MARPRNDERLDRIYEYIKRNPGLRAGKIAKKLGYDNKTVQRALHQLADRGDYLSEEGDRLYKADMNKI